MLLENELSKTVNDKIIRKNHNRGLYCLTLYGYNIEVLAEGANSDLFLSDLIPQ